MRSGCPDPRRQQRNRSYPMTGLIRFRYPAGAPRATIRTSSNERCEHPEDSMKPAIRIFFTAAAAATAFLLAPGAQAADAEAAQALARQNNCLKCHSVDKEKEGPAFKKTAAKYKGKA